MNDLTLQQQQRICREANEMVEDRILKADITDLLSALQDGGTDLTRGLMRAIKEKDAVPCLDWLRNAFYRQWHDECKDKCENALRDELYDQERSRQRLGIFARF